MIGIRLLSGNFSVALKVNSEITSGDGEVRRFNSGDVFLLEDIQGRGHVTRVIGEAEFVAAVVQLAVKP